MKFAVLIAALALAATSALAQVGPVTPASPAGSPRTDKVVSVQGCPTCSHIIVDQGAGWNFQGSVAAGATSGFANPFAIAGFSSVSGGVGSGELNALLVSPTGAAAVTDTNDGVAGTGISQPTGGSGTQGWLSGLYKALTGTLPVSAASLPLPTGAATAANQSGNSGWNETTTPIGANATFNGGNRAAPAWATKFICSVYAAGGTGTLSVYDTISSGLTVVYTMAIPSASGQSLQVPITGASSNLFQCAYVNGSSALSSFVIESGFTK